MTSFAWLLKLLLLCINIGSSFKALKPVVRQRRSSKEPKTLSTADRARRRAIKEQLVCWVVFCCFAWLERVTDRTVAWLPFYNHFKALALLLILAGRAALAQMLFKKLVKPLVLPYERALDAIGYVVGEVLELVVAALVFPLRRAGQWWQGKAQEPDVPAILKGLRSPHRPPLARTLASSIESAQARSTEEVSKRFSRPVVTSQPEPAPAPAAPKPTLRRPPSTTSLSASTLGRNSSSSYAPFRPSKSAATREHQSLSASTSRLPRNSAEGAGRLSASTSLYPTLSGSPPVDVWGTSREATSRRLAPATSHKGKQRESLDPLPLPPPALAPVFSTAAPKINHLNTSTRNYRAISPPPPSPPQPQFDSPPRAEPPAFVPPTPAPPGAFHSSFAASSPALLRAAALVQEEERVVQNSPRAKASSAIAGLADELGSGVGGDLGLSFGPGKRKGGGIGGLGSGAKRVKTGATAKAAPRTRKTRRRVDEDDESGQSGDDYVEEEPKSQKATSPRKRKAPPRDQRDAEDDGVETQGRTASRRLATSTRRAAAPASSSSKPPAASSRSKTSMPLAASRSRTSRSAATATSTPASTSDDEDHGLARSTRRKVPTAELTVVAPARKARRIALGRQRQQETEQEMEVDGVPVVVRRTAGRR